MATLNKKSLVKWAKIAFVLLLLVSAFSFGTYAWIVFASKNLSNYNNYNQRYQDNPSAAVNILANGTVVSPIGYPSVPIVQQGDVYTLTGDLQRELVIGRNNIVVDGKGFSIGMETFASNHQTIALSDVKNATLKDVNIIGPYFALSFLHAQNNTVQDVTGGTIYLFDSANNIITQSNASFRFSQSDNNSIKNCNVGGFEFDHSDYNYILNNDCSASSGRDLYFQDSSNNLVFGNAFGKIWWWISMYGDSTNNTIVGNDIRTDQQYLADSLVGTNYIYHNNFLAFNWNKTTTTNSINVWSNNGEGNYWSNYNGADANHDGISDSPYIIDAKNSDNYPLMNPVDIANEPFPILTK